MVLNMPALEIFDELLFGSGAWIGLMLILGFMFVIAYKAKYTSVLFLLILLFLNFEYWGQIGYAIDVTSNFMWSIVISYVAMVFMGLVLYHDIKHR